MSQANGLSTAIPASTGNRLVIYIPEIRDSARIGSYLPELDLRETTRDAVISDIAAGQHERVTRVFAVDIAAGKSWDASKEIAEQVVAQVVDHHGSVPSHCRDFIDRHLPIAYVNEVEAAHMGRRGRVTFALEAAE